MAHTTIATIKLKSPDQAQRVISLREGERLRLGRDDNNDIVIPDPAISRVHATISASASGVIIADNSSTNGTFVNGKKISMRDVQSGDVIDLGSSKLVVEIQADRTVEQLSSISGSRAMTAQLKPVSVTVMVGTLLLRDGKNPGTAPAQQICSLWIEHVAGIIKEHGGVVDKEIGNHLVALWLGNNAKQQALGAINAARETTHLTGVLSQQISTAALDAKLILSSGQGLKGVIGVGREVSGNSFTILGDPINVAFTMEEGVADLADRIILCPSTAELVQLDCSLELSRSLSDGSNGEMKVYRLS